MLVPGMWFMNINDLLQSELNCKFFFVVERNECLKFMKMSVFRIRSQNQSAKTNCIGGSRRSVDCVVMREAEERQGAAESAGPPTYHTQEAEHIPNNPKILLQDKQRVFSSIRLIPSVYSRASCTGRICSRAHWKCGDHFCSFCPLLQKLIKFCRRKRQKK